MEVIITLPDSILPNNLSVFEFKCFLQLMANRICTGELRYGVPNRRKKYFTRLQKEVKVYKQKGNMEQLVNAANYAFLESVAPEHSKFNFNASIDSVTRKELGGNIA